MRQVIYQPTVAAFILVADAVRLIHQNDVHMAYLVGALYNRLNTSEGYRLPQVALIQTGAVDAKRRIRPNLQHLVRVLLDDLLDVRHQQYARARPLLYGVLADGGEDRKSTRP